MFYVEESKLSDRSVVYNVMIRGQLVCEAVSEKTAYEMADGMNVVFNAFKLCESDRRVEELVDAIDKTMVEFFKEV